MTQEICPTCGTAMVEKKTELPSWFNGKARFGDSLSLRYCPNCDAANKQEWYRDFVAGKVDINGNPIKRENPLPRLVRQMTFEAFQMHLQVEEAWTIALDYAKNYPHSAEGGKGLLFFGTVGAGKSHLAGAIANYLFEKGFSVQWVNSPQFISELKRSFDGGVSESSIMDKYLRAGLLILDDIGSEKPTEWVEARLYELINARIERMVPIIFTSNCSQKVLQDRLGDRIVSRMRGMSRPVKMVASDYRLSKGAS